MHETGPTTPDTLLYFCDYVCNRIPVCSVSSLLALCASSGHGCMTSPSRLHCITHIMRGNWNRLKPVSGRSGTMQGLCYRVAWLHPSKPKRKRSTEMAWLWLSLFCAVILLHLSPLVELAGSAALFGEGLRLGADRLSLSLWRVCILGQGSARTRRFFV